MLHLPILATATVVYNKQQKAKRAERQKAQDELIQNEIQRLRRIEELKETLRVFNMMEDIQFQLERRERARVNEVRPYRKEDYMSFTSVNNSDFWNKMREPIMY